MSVTREVVEQVAELAQLQIDENEFESVMQKMNEILEMVEDMQSVDTSGIEPMAHPLDATQTLREDQITETDQHDRYQQLAPEAESGLYLVPRVVE